MFSSWSKYIGSCVSRASALARSCFLGRNLWRGRCRDLRRQVEELRGELEAALQTQRRVETLNEELRSRVQAVQAERDQARNRAIPLGEPPHGHHYGAGLIALSVNLARRIGLRPTEHALTIFFDWLGVPTEIPRYQSIRLWMQRIGLARMDQAPAVNGGTWLVDLTNQIGLDHVLAVTRLREESTPAPSAPLQHEDLEVLALLPGRKWGRAEVDEAYRLVEFVCGTPRAVLTDGAVELREPVANLGKSAGNTPLSRRDLKHFLANQLERLVGADPRYEEFQRHASGLRPALQQTDLAHFVPPALKQKSRFMNLAPTIQWADAVLWHLNHFESHAREGLAAKRLQSKFGWLRQFAPDIKEWKACHEVIACALNFVRRAGIYRGAARDFARLARDKADGARSRELALRTRQFLKSQAQGLRDGEHLPLSTEVLESAFSSYKQLIRQHAKEGVSTLLLAFPTLLRPTTPHEVKRCLERVSVADVVTWGKTNLPDRFAVRRTQMFREARTGAIHPSPGATAISLAP